MAQRNPLNDRYRGEGPSGKTRRSASSAKPKRPAATPTGGTPSPKLSARDSAQRSRAAAADRRRADAALRREVAAVVPTDPAYRTWRIVWWVMIIIGMATVAASWIFRAELEQQTTLGWGLLAGSYGAIAGALLIDFFKIRPLRKRAQAAALADKQKASKKN